MRALLLSGGIDSIALAFWLRPEVAITVDYGQLAATAEIRASAAVAQGLRIQHEIIRVNMKELGSGDLVGSSPSDFAPKSEWWPFRNQMLVTLAAMRAITLGVKEIMIGTVASDAFHVDGTPEFIDILDRLLCLQEGQLRLTAPAIDMTSVELLKESAVPQHVIAWSHSCHASEFACGSCRGCCKHYNVTAEMGWDPH